MVLKDRSTSNGKNVEEVYMQLKRECDKSTTTTALVGYATTTESVTNAPNDWDQEDLNSLEIKREAMGVVEDGEEYGFMNQVQILQY